MYLIKKFTVFLNESSYCFFLNGNTFFFWVWNVFIVQAMGQESGIFDILLAFLTRNMCFFSILLNYSLLTFLFTLFLGLYGLIIFRKMILSLYLVLLFTALFFPTFLILNYCFLFSSLDNAQQEVGISIFRVKLK